MTWIDSYVVRGRSDAERRSLLMCCCALGWPVGIKSHKGDTVGKVAARIIVASSAALERVSY